MAVPYIIPHHAAMVLADSIIIIIVLGAVAASCVIATIFLVFYLMKIRHNRSQKLFTHADGGSLSSFQNLVENESKFAMSLPSTPAGDPSLFRSPFVSPPTSSRPQAPVPQGSIPRQAPASEMKSSSIPRVIRSDLAEPTPVSQPVVAVAGHTGESAAPKSVSFASPMTATPLKLDDKRNALDPARKILSFDEAKSADIDAHVSTPKTQAWSEGRL